MATKNTNLKNIIGIISVEEAEKIENEACEMRKLMDRSLERKTERIYDKDDTIQ